MITDPVALRPLFQISPSTYTFRGAGAVKVLSDNAWRVTVSFSSPTGAAFFLWPTSDVSSTISYNITGIQTFTMHDFGAMVQGEWWGNVTSATAPLCIIEVLYKPEFATGFGR